MKISISTKSIEKYVGEIVKILKCNLLIIWFHEYQKNSHAKHLLSRAQSELGRAQEKEKWQKVELDLIVTLNHDKDIYR